VSALALPIIAVARDPNWQSNKATVRDRNSAMFNNSLMADIHFLVGPTDGQRRVPAHKYVLATGSTVFYAMLYGGLSDSQAEDIVVPDVDPDAFLAMLRYLYCDEISLEPDNVLATLYTGKKYIVPHLARECVKYLETSLKASNACLLLSQSRLFEEPELMQRCWDVIDAQAEIALRSEGFTDIDFHTLHTILQRETLNCSELTVFLAACEWARAECARRGQEAGPGRARAVLGPAMQCIRFPAMSVEEFADHAVKSDMLDLQEITDIFLNFTAKQKPVLQFPVRARLVPNLIERERVAVAKVETIIPSDSYYGRHGLQCACRSMNRTVCRGQRKPLTKASFAYTH
jgi:BTB/POZ domain-containing protein 3/6